jgi:hypothetical protein
LVVPRSLSDRTRIGAGRVFNIERTGRTNVETTLALQVRKLYRWIRPFFSAGESGALNRRRRRMA